MVDVEELNIIIDLETGPLAKNSGKARQIFTANFKKMTGETKKLNNAVKTTGGALDKLKGSFGRLATALAATVGVAKLFTSTMQSFADKDILGKTADKLGITTQALVELRLAAEQTAGVTSGVLDTALQRMVRRISEAKEGFGEAKGALRELNIDIQAIGKLSPDQQFRMLADAMANVTDQGDRVRLAMKLFDTEGVALVNTLKGGSAVLDEFAVKAKNLGTSISRLDAAKAELVNDAFNDMKEAITGIFNSVSNQLAPAFFAFAKVATQLAIVFRKNQEEMTSLGDVGMRVVAALAQGVHTLVVAWEVVKTAVATVKFGIAEGMSRVVNIITDVTSRIQGMGLILKGTMEGGADAARMAWLGIKKAGLSTIHAIIEGLVQQGLALAKATGDNRLGAQMEKRAQQIANSVQFIGAELSLTNLELRKLEESGGPGLDKVAEGISKLTQSFDSSAAKATGIDFLDNFSAGLESQSDIMREKMGNQLSQLATTANAFGGKTAFEYTLGLKDTFDSEMAKLDLTFGANAENEGQPNPLEDERVIREKMVQDELTRLNEERIKKERDDFVAQQTFWQTSLQNRLSVASSIMGNLATLMQSKSKKMFEIGKVAAISQAIVDTWASANKAMATLPYPLNLAAAAATAAAGFVNVQNIRAQQFSKGGASGGSSSSAGGSLGAVDAQEASQPVNNTTFNVALQGQSFGQQQVRSLINQINDGTDDNVTLNVTQRVD